MRTPPPKISPQDIRWMIAALEFAIEDPGPSMASKESLTDVLDKLRVLHKYHTSLELS